MKAKNLKSERLFLTDILLFHVGVLYEIGVTVSLTYMLLKFNL